MHNISKYFVIVFTALLFSVGIGGSYLSSTAKAEQILPFAPLASSKTNNQFEYKQSGWSTQKQVADNQLSSQLLNFAQHWGAKKQMKDKLFDVSVLEGDIKKIIIHRLVSEKNISIGLPIQKLIYPSHYFW
jgi:hypothetical protein